MSFFREADQRIQKGAARVLVMIGKGRSEIPDSAELIIRELVELLKNPKNHIRRGGVMGLGAMIGHIGEYDRYFDILKPAFSPLIGLLDSSDEEIVT